MLNTTDFYFQNYSEWHKAITERCKIKLTSEYVQSRIASLQNQKDKSTREFKLKYGDQYLNQVIEWFKQADQGS
jgi:wyosine [tRNA(Phe)-imidazoG37] synthetase (radical SAM superfamily)